MLRAPPSEQLVALAHSGEM